MQSSSPYNSIHNANGDLLYSDERGNWYRPPRSPRRENNNNNNNKTQSSNQNNNNTEKDTFYENIYRAADKLNHNHNNQHSVYSSPAARSVSQQSQNNNNNIVMTNISNNKNQNNNNHNHNSCWVCGILSNPQSTLPLSAYPDAPPLFFPHKNKNNSQNNNHQENNISTLTLCERCSAALSIPLAHTTAEVLARCQPTLLLRMERSISFLHFLREYKMMFTIVAERVRRAAERSAYLSKNNNNENNQSYENNNNLFLEYPFTVQRKVISQFLSALEEVMERDSVQQALPKNNNNQNKYENNNNTNNNIPRLFPSERFLLSSEIIHLERVLADIEAREKQQEQFKLENNFNKNNEKNEYNVVPMDFVNHHNHHSTKTLQELEKILSTGEPLDNNNKLNNFNNNNKQIFTDMTEKAMREAFQTNSTIPYRNNNHLNNNNNNKNENHNNKLAAGMVQSPSPARDYSEARSIPNNNENILGSYYAGNFDFMKKKELDYTNRLIEQLHAQNMLTPSLLENNQHKKDNLLCLTQQENELAVLDYYLTSTSQTNKNKKLELEAVLQNNHHQNNNELIPVLELLKAEQVQRENAEAALKVSHDKILALEKVNDQNSETILKYNLSFTFVEHLTMMNRYFSLLQDQFENVALQKSLLFSEEMANIIRVTQRQAAKAPFYAKMNSVLEKMKKSPQKNHNNNNEREEEEVFIGERDEEVEQDITCRNHNKNINNNNNNANYKFPTGEDVKLTALPELMKSN